MNYTSKRTTKLHLWLTENTKVTLMVIFKITELRSLMGKFLQYVRHIDLLYNNII